ncbi:MAG: type II toxin-antitoxin system VapC family toxin [Chloroflexota bacterium]|nr:type II toxin-antitoxin system VapC family toxin [Chloroflexota bacterium]MDE2960247.1 type II toxin-antitoxin system VapC family toxin [Chloroflexota bacterium]
MTSQVIDTSALVKYVLPEEDSPIVENLVAFHRAGLANLMAPAYVLVESANVLWKHVQRSSVRPDDAVPALRALRDLGIRLVPDADLLEDALILAVDNGITVYDALFCALAARESIQLITADSALFRRLTGTDIQATMLSEWSGSG